MAVIEAQPASREYVLVRENLPGHTTAVRLKSAVAAQLAGYVNMAYIIQSHNSRSIVKTKGVCGGVAHVRGTRVPVWGIEQARQEGCSPSQIVRMYPSLTLESVQAAIEYADDHRNDIVGQIQANQEA